MSLVGAKQCRGGCRWVAGASVAGFPMRWLVGGVCVMRVGATGASVIAPDRGGPRPPAFSQSSFYTRQSSQKLDILIRVIFISVLGNAKCFATRRERQPGAEQKKRERLCARRGRFRSSSVNSIRREGRKLGRTTSTRCRAKTRATVCLLASFAFRI